MLEAKQTNDISYSTELDLCKASQVHTLVSSTLGSS